MDGAAAFSCWACAVCGRIRDQYLVGRDFATASRWFNDGLRDPARRTVSLPIVPELFGRADRMDRLGPVDVVARGTGVRAVDRGEPGAPGAQPSSVVQRTVCRLPARTAGDYSI